MNKRLSFKNLPKIQAKRFKKLRLEKERSRGAAVRSLEKRTPRRRGRRSA